MKRFLLVHAIILWGIGLFAQTGSDLIISEYVEGWSNNKSLELYNPTDSPIDLSNYRITRYSNGSTPPASPPLDTRWYVVLSGMLEPYKTKVFVLDKRNPEGQDLEYPVWDALQARADTFVCPIYNDSYALYFNGDDAVALEKLDDTFIDIFGKIGERPVNADGGTSNPTGGWTDTDPYHTGVGVILSANHTLVRKPEIVNGVITPVDKFNILAEWDSLPANTFTGLGWHECTASPDTNQKPSFDETSYAFNINIEDPIGTSVGTISATDPNGDELTYYISRGNSYDPFRIDRETGEIKTVKEHDIQGLWWRDYTLTIDVTDGTSPISIQVSVTVEGGYTGIHILSHSVNIYPNPVTSGFLQLNASEGITGIEIFNLTGKLMYSQLNKDQSSDVLVRLEDLNAGLYTIKISFLDDTMTARKILVR
jgi:hypothetical protein